MAKRRNSERIRRQASGRSARAEAVAPEPRPEGRRRRGSRPPADPPTVDELADLARRLAVQAPETLPALFWCICRSSRVVDACRRHEPSGAHLAAIHRAHPTGAALVELFRAGRTRLAKWTATANALDDLLPPIPDEAIPLLGDDPTDDDRAGQDANRRAAPSKLVD